METTKLEQLETLRNYSTIYEMALVAPSGETFLLGYGPKSGAALRRVTFRRAQRVTATMSDPGATVTKATKDAIALSGGWVAKFTGRTQRAAICEGELQPMVQP